MTETPFAQPLPGFVPWPLDVAERYRTLGVWQGQSIGDWFCMRALQHAERPALVDGRRQVTYAQLAQWVERFAQNLVVRGAKPRDRILVQLPNSIELVVTLLGASRAGLIPVLALPQHRQLELRAFVERAAPRFAVLSSALAGADTRALGHGLLEQSKSLRAIFVHQRAADASQALAAGDRFEALSSLLEPSADVALPQVAGSEVGLLQLSGGSTGVPKLIARTHDDYLYSVRQSAVVCELDEHSRYLAVLPMTHNFTLSSPGVLGVLDRGGCIVSCPGANPNVVFGLLRSQAITLTAAVPSLVLAWVEAIERRPELRAERPRFVLQVGGAKLSADLGERAVRALGCELQQVFGMAEGLVNYTARRADAQTRLHTQGRPMSVHDELRVMDPADPEGTPLPLGATGELQTRGPYTIRGYYDNPEANVHSFTRDGFYRTFDLVRLTLEGDVVVEGRIGDRILRAGEKISPDEVERELRAHPLVVDVAVVGLPDPVLGQRTCAFIVPRDDAQLSLSQVRAFLRGAGLAEFKLPDLLQLCSDLPRTAVGKTDRNRLRRGPAEGVYPSAQTVTSQSET